MSKNETAVKTPNEQLQKFLEENGFTLAIRLISPNGSVLQLPDALKPDYQSWQIAVQVERKNGPQRPD